ncbi:hypothetical protein ES703_23767 [subsurface metagenome]
MKFVTISVWNVGKAAELASLFDKLVTTPPSGFKVLANYVCLAHPVSGLPSGTGVSIIIAEAESAEAIAAANYPSMLAGADINTVPVLELPVEPKTAELEKKYRA